ncbi:MAG: ATP-dependent metallopeptidase FtsH/Yme1/Tma family protein [Defluviitaleaceae bacterium]|nr:ATP-dependent metallopeptidase FtsH/Yme1/Tma family protein [Defluviitaleaceae bacterium]
MEKFRRFYKIGILCAIAASVVVLFMFFADDGAETQFVTYSQFAIMAESGDVARVVLSDGPVVQFYVHNSDIAYETSNPRNPALKENLLLMGIYVTEHNGLSASGLMSGVFSIAIIGGMFFLIIRMIGRSGGKGAMALNVAAADANGVNVGFDHVAGNDEAKEGVQDVVDFIKNPEKYAKYGARMPRGVIFYGPPGTGKTLMAKAIAGEAGVPFFAVSGSDFVQMYVGVGASRVRELFKKARAAGRAVIFIDEIDAVGKTRSGSVQGGNDERDQTLNALLTEMSGFGSGEGIVVIAATNRLDTLDEALLRPGRFDRQVEIGLPDLNGRKSILETHRKNKPLADNINLEELARQTVYFSGAMLENLLNEAAIQAAKSGAGKIGQKEIDTAYYTIIAGSEKKDRSRIKEQERRITAYHEGGHALAAKLLSPENTVPKITIIPSTKGAAGFCVNVPPDKMYFTKTELENQVITLLAGRAAEEAVFGAENITTGASNDIQRANHIIREYVTKFGMSETAGLAELSEDEKRREHHGLMKSLYGRALELVARHRHTLDKIAEALLDKESLCEKELDELIA